jgi:hypothetical protein
MFRAVLAAKFRCRPPAIVEGSNVTIMNTLRFLAKEGSKCRISVNCPGTTPAAAELERVVTGMKSGRETVDLPAEQGFGPMMRIKTNRSEGQLAAGTKEETSRIRRKPGNSGQLSDSFVMDYNHPLAES